MKRFFAVTMFAAALLVGSSAAFAQMMKDDPMVGGAAMYPNKTIVANAMNSADHTTLVAAVKAAGLVDTLNGKGPFTVFAPTNDAFAQLPAGTVDMLLKKGNGQARLKTVSGGTLTAMMDGNNIVVRDEKGGTATVTIADVYQSNGVIHVVNAVLMPN